MASIAGGLAGLYSLLCVQWAACSLPRRPHWWTHYLLMCSESLKLISLTRRWSLYCELSDPPAPPLLLWVLLCFLSCQAEKEACQLLIPLHSPQKSYWLITGLQGHVVLLLKPPLQLERCSFPRGVRFTWPNNGCSSPRSISAVWLASGSAVHLPEFHYTTVHAALKRYQPEWDWHVCCSFLSFLLIYLQNTKDE